MSEWHHEVSEDTVLYKYRTFSNFENVVDILVNSRLYAATYDSMNDPLEGSYGFLQANYPNDSEWIKKIDAAIQDQKFCSLSKKSNIDLMWSHYADGHRGICIGVKLKTTKQSGIAYEVRYDDFPNLAPVCDSKELNRRAQKILRYKIDCWEYEEEVRLFSSDGHLVDVQIVDVILGRRADKRLASLVKKLVDKFLPGVKVTSFEYKTKND